MYPPAPSWVRFEERRRVEEAETAYEHVKETADLFGMSREEYVFGYLSTLTPLTWTATASAA